MSIQLIGYWMVFPCGRHTKLIKDKIASIRKILPKKDLRKLMRAGVIPDEYDKDTIWQDIESDCREVEDVDLDSLQTGDSNYCEMKINGHTVGVWFAGESTWGDGPDGEGYELFRRMVRLGIDNVLWRAIPWDKKTKTPVVVTGNRRTQ